MPIVSGPADSVRADRRATEAGWQAAMRSAIRDPAQLCRILRLPAHVAAGAQSGARHFPVFAPRAYVAKMAPGDPADPLLRQVLPLPTEAENTGGYTLDPVGDGPATLQPGLVQKYAGRALMVTTGACAVHCRYCFRRHFPYSGIPKSATAWRPALERIAADTTISEVLLSGGDPLTLMDDKLRELMGQLAAIDHVRRLRVHTRLPIMIPERVTARLLDCLCQTRLVTLVVIHANHPREIDQRVGAAISQMVDAGLPVLNQSVLLRGVNDDVDTLEQLCLRLIDQRVIPYYLHQLDRVRGAGHFEVPVPRGRQLVQSLRSRLPGYAVPRFVREIPGELGKRVLA